MICNKNNKDSLPSSVELKDIVIQPDWHTIMESNLSHLKIVRVKRKKRGVTLSIFATGQRRPGGEEIISFLKFKSSCVSDCKSTFLVFYYVVLTVARGLARLNFRFLDLNKKQLMSLSALSTMSVPQITGVIR